MGCELENGLALSQAFYEEYGVPLLESRFPHLIERTAAGLVGEGSECLGFDDALSRDHDWGAGFCLWLGEEDFAQYGADLRRAYEKDLPKTYGGYPVKESGEGSPQRVGVFSVGGFYRRYIGLDRAPESLEEWLSIPESYLAVVTNGKVFCDPAGDFTAIRKALLDFYPEDARKKKLAARCVTVTQSGQYNYPRCLSRGERVGAALAREEFIRSAISCAHLLNRRYTPFYKWMHRSLKGLPLLSELAEPLEALAAAPLDEKAQPQMEAVCAALSDELRRQGLSREEGNVLQVHGRAIQASIEAPNIRTLPILFG